MDTVLLSSALTGVAVFAALMAIFDPLFDRPETPVDAGKAIAMPRHRYASILVTRHDRKIPVSSSSTAAGRRTNWPSAVEVTGATSSGLTATR